MDMRRHPTAKPHMALLTTGALLVLAGCSSSSTSASLGTAGTAGTAPGSAAATTGGHVSGTSVTVDETEFALHLSQTSFPPGAYTFVAEDHGKISHALAIQGPGVPATQTKVLSPGGTAQLTVTLQAGSYDLWCPVDSHKELGMDTHIQVGGTASTSHLP